jgi:hypothetical protein
MAHKNTDTFIAEIGTTGKELGGGKSMVGFIFINVVYIAIVVALFFIQVW